jgi:hypothetical protein
MTVELTVWVFYTFRRYTGLYFWSVLITTWGVSLHSIGFVLKDCVPACNWILSTILAEIGWVSMVTGFSMVLYSRLHLVVRNQRTLRLVLALIITDAFLFHVPTVAFQFGLSDKKTHHKYLPYMAPMERVQIIGFSIQEILISSIYIYATLQMFKGSFNKKIQRTTAFVILIQVIVILCDVVVIALDYAQYFTLKAVIHSFVYAFKLQLEFVILNQFKEVVATGGLAPKGLDALQDLPERLESPPSPPSGPKGKRWLGSWSSASSSAAPSSEGSERNNSICPIAPDVPVIQIPQAGNVGVARSSSKAIKQYVPERTDAVHDIERRYLGAWNQRDV